jgi:putative membrane protein insertion efficiency factor
MNTFSVQMKRLVLKIIKIYQKTLSIDQGFLKIFFPFYACRFRPTCSEYTYQAVGKYGIIKGGLMGLWRVMRCHPFSRGGDDPVDKSGNA